MTPERKRSITRVAAGAFNKKRPAFYNSYKLSWTVKFCFIDDTTFELAKAYLEGKFPEIAVKRCSLEGALVYFPKPGTPPEHRDRWAARKYIAYSYQQTMIDFARARATETWANYKQNS